MADVNSFVSTQRVPSSVYATWDIVGKVMEEVVEEVHLLNSYRESLLINY